MATTLVSPSAGNLDRRDLQHDLPPLQTIDERRARRDLRAQIARLERELSALQAAAWASATEGPAPRSAAPVPHLLDLEELERIRDRLILSMSRTRQLIQDRDDLHRKNIRLLQRAIAQPHRHKFLQVPLSAIGEPGCGAYKVVPRLGLLGMLMNWWQVKLSSGCP